MLNVTAALLPCIAPAVLAGYLLVAVTGDTGGPPDTWHQVVELGVGGLVVFLVTAPLMRWVLRRLDAQQKQNEKLIESLTASVRVTQKESATHARAVDALLEEMREVRLQLERLPERVAERLNHRGPT